MLVTLSEQIMFELSSFYKIFPLKVARNLFSFPDSDKIYKMPNSMNYRGVLWQES